MKRAALLLLVLALAAGGSAWAARDRIWPACSWKLRPAIATPGADLVFFGDSHVCRAQVSERYAAHDPAWRGFEGATSAQLAERAGQALAYRPRRVLLIAGTNDVVQGRTPEQFETDYARLVSLLAPGRDLALVTVPPCRHRLCAAPVEQDRLLEFNRRIARIAQARGARLIDLHAAIAASDGSLPAAMTSDGIHLSPQAYARFHALVADWVEGSARSR